jgi:hypothetical protein
MKVTFVIGFACSLFATTAWAGGGASAFAPGQNKDAFISYYGAGGDETGSPTPGGIVNNLGGAISGGFYGNTSNSGESPYAPANGHGVTPSISPGPQVVGGGGPGTGTSIGDFIQSCAGTC